MLFYLEKFKYYKKSNLLFVLICAIAISFFFCTLLFHWLIPQRIKYYAPTAKPNTITLFRIGELERLQQNYKIKSVDVFTISGGFLIVPDDYFNSILKATNNSLDKDTIIDRAVNREEKERQVEYDKLLPQWQKSEIVNLPIANTAPLLKRSTSDKLVAKILANSSLKSIIFLDENGQIPSLDYYILQMQDLTELNKMVVQEEDIFGNNFGDIATHYNSIFEYFGSIYPRLLELFVFAVSAFLIWIQIRLYFKNQNQNLKLFDYLGISKQKSKLWHFGYLAILLLFSTLIAIVILWIFWQIPLYINPKTKDTFSIFEIITSILLQNGQTIARKYI